MSKQSQPTPQNRDLQQGVAPRGEMEGEGSHCVGTKGDVTLGAEGQLKFSFIVS